ncbi:cupin domain-containing protein [Algoriphagus sp.]|uniref:cupin domain-containing protein n=1 Tax=Algoriphagus sp. TaxID=1872435 RepID=UPI0025FAB9BD|nr:cupin domain-containing protein [Algoriphagus sp.]
MDPKSIINWFNLQENTAEGGYSVSTYTAKETISSKELPGFKAIEQNRHICGAIYYFLDQGTFSAMHRVTGDMIYHFYSGDPIQMLLLYPEGSSTRSELCIFSNDIAGGGNPMKVIPGGTWMGSRLVAGGSYALMGVTMSPAFDPADYFIAKRKDLISQYPEQETLITALTRS